RAAAKGRGLIYFSVGILLLLSIVFVGIIMLSNDEPTNSNQSSSISENSNNSKAQDKQNSNYKIIIEEWGGAACGSSNDLIQAKEENSDQLNSDLNETGSGESSSGESDSGSGEETSAAGSGESGSGSGEETSAAGSGESGSGSGEETNATGSGESVSGSGEETSTAGSGESVSGSGEETSTAGSGESGSESGEETSTAGSGESVSGSGEETSAAGSGESGSGSGEETSAAGSGESGSESGEESRAKNPDESEKPTQEIETTNSEPPNTKDTKDTEDRKLPLKANSPWSLQYSIGGNYITKNSIAGSPKSIAIRKAQESNIFTSQVNFAVNYDLNKLRLSTGLSFAQHGENLSYSPVTYDSTFVSSFTFVVDSTSMDTTYFYNYDTTTVTNTAAMEGNKNNRHSYITVPINFGYSFNIIDNKFTITPKGGVGIRFLVAGSGNYITDNLTGILEEKDKPITFSYNGSVEFTYHFGNKSVFFAPTYHSTFSTFKSLHRYSGIGVKFGIVFKL
ncbi:MAG: hypothetical protein ACJAXI_002242, partial [Crocinitomicaceae bacterium]